ncbi:MAG: glycosyltransferase family 39 protein [Magnetococcales bacterium]|nr:glycosyltransferase family 39 protein [Magnetococcales bacterium]
MKESLSRSLTPFIIQISLALLAFTVRQIGIEAPSITQDESTMVLFAKGVLERGYPFITQRFDEFLISTYELVPYPIAFSMWLHGGFSEAAVRYPASLFATGTTLLIYRFGVNLFDQRTGFFAALTFALLPWAIYWGSNAFYPSQLQFFALSFIMVVHKILYDKNVSAKWFYISFLVYIPTYLSWEGSGFILPVVFITALLLRWGQWHWLLNLHSWLAGTLLIFLVVSQLTYRTLMREPFNSVFGGGRSEISFASLGLSKVNFDPLYYFISSTSESHVLLTLLFLGGLIFNRKDWHLRYLHTIILISIATITLLLGFYSLRYIFFLLPLVCLAAATTTIHFADRITTNLGDARSLFTVKLAKILIIGGLLINFLLVSTPWGVRPLELMERFQKNRPNELRPDLRGFGFRSVITALQNNFRPGDVVLTQASFPHTLYTGTTGDYYLQNIGIASIFFHPNSKLAYIDKWIGNPVLRSKAELEEVLANSKRVWFAQAPNSHSNIDDDLYNFVTTRMKMVDESFDGSLYLWVNPAMQQSKAIMSSSNTE